MASRISAGNAGSGGVAALAGRLAEEHLPSRLAGQDPALGGPDALCWATSHKTSRPLIGEVTALRAALHAEGLDRIVLAGPSRAPGVLAEAEGFALTVLDTADPGQVADALAGDLDRTVLVTGGSDPGTDAVRRVFTAAFTAKGIDPASRTIAITAPDSPPDFPARQVFPAGDSSALGAFGLVPAGLAGADIAAVLDQAAAAFDVLSADTPDNPALLLGAALAESDTVVLTDSGSDVPGFADWAGELLAGTGLVPVVVESPGAPGFADAGPEVTPVVIGPRDGSAIFTDGPLGGLFLCWEFAAAIAATRRGVLLGDPVTSWPKPVANGPDSSILDGVIEIHASEGLLPDGVDSVAGALRALLAATPERGHLAVRAYLDRLDDASAVLLRAELARRTGTQTTFGWGPGVTGRSDNAVFLQVTGTPDNDLDIPDQQYTLGALQLAQAVGDGRVLAERGRPVLRLHLTDRAAGLVALFHSLAEVSR